MLPHRLSRDRFAPITLVFLLVVVGGCPAMFPQGRPDPCAPVADRYTATIAAMSTTKFPPRVIKRYTGTVYSSCARSVWSEEARSCFLGATTPGRIDECTELLTPGQQTLLINSLKEASEDTEW